MAVFYLITTFLLCALVLLGKKSERKENFMVWLVCGSFLVLCLQALTGGLMGLLALPVNLLTVSVANLACCIPCGWWVYRKGRQAYYFSPLDIAGILVMLLLLGRMAVVRFGTGLNEVTFVSVDSGSHASFAKDIALSGKITEGKYFAALITGMIMNVCRSFTGSPDLMLYRGYILAELLFTAYSGLLFWALLRDGIPDGKLKALLPLVLTPIYWAGYPVNATLFGFSYFEIALCCLTLLLFLLRRYLRKGENRLLLVLMLNLVLLGIFVSYTLFVPAAFVGVFVTVALDMWKRDRKKILSMKNILTMLEIFLLPCILGLIYNFRDMGELSTATGGIARDGGCYTDLYTDFILLVPFAALGIWAMVKKKDSTFFLPILAAELVFALFMFVKAMFWQVSAYYYMKNNTFLWLLCWLAVGEAILYMMERNRAAILFAVYFYGILLMGMFGDGVIMKRSRLITVQSDPSFFHVIYYNRAMYKYGIPLQPEHLELFRYADENLENENIAAVGAEFENIWFKTRTGKDVLFTYGSQEDLKAMVKEKDVQYICVTESDTYNICRDYLDSLDIVFSNGKGKIVKTAE